MIPTTLSANTPLASNLNSSGTINNQQKMMASSSKEMVIGIAALIIEGRAFVEDEFHTLSLRQVTQQSTPRGPNNSTDFHETSHTSSFSTTATSTSSSSPSSSSSSMLHGTDLGGSNTFSAFGLSGRQSPKPSTSKAATGQTNNSNSHIPHLINITTNHAFGGATTTTPLFIETPNSYHSSSSAASSAESTHQRWTQKLCQLRQASGAANLTAPYEQKVAIDAAHISSGGEPELVSLAIHEPNMTAERGATGSDYEIVRRVMLIRSSAATINVANTAGSSGSSPSSGGSENFLHSLQSLATTCLRGSNPTIDTPTGLNYTSGSNAYNKYNTYRVTSATTPPRFQSPYTSLDLQSGSASSGGSGVQSPRLLNVVTCSKRNPKVTSTVTSNANSTTFSLPCALTPKPLPSTSHFVAHTSSINSSSSANSATTCNSNSYPQQGPHCDQFLRKMGLAKGEAADAEEHYCDMSYVNITCSRWRAYCLKIEGIIERGEPVCLEVFLGPSNHRILVEQWIFTYKEKVSPPTMTLPSLCSAIRSQLYFSQISAWCDLIRKSDKSIFDTGRIVYGGAAGMMGCAGDLATTIAANLSCTPPNTTSNATVPGGNSNLSATTAAIATTLPAAASLRPRLNVFYRIRPHDATACFNSKPNIHNFPNVNISENCSISICLKSLPRINGGIPKIGTMISAPNENFLTANTANAAIAKFSIDETPRSSRQNLGKILITSSTTTTTAATATATVATTSSLALVCNSNCDNLKLQTNNLGNYSTSSCSSSAKVANFNRYKNNNTPKQLMNIKTSKEVENNLNTQATASSSKMHKCKFYIDESEQNFLNDKNDENDDDIDYDELSGQSCSNGSCGSLSHRERQLLKYRKRMLKRDKKHQYRKSNEDNSLTVNHQHQPMEQGDDDDADDADDDEVELSEQLSVQTVTLATVRQRAAIKMISTGTQTAAVGCCKQCGGEKSLICLKCKSTNVCVGDIDEMDACSVNSLSSSEIISTPRSKGDLLLQAIQRTPKAAKHKKQTSRNNGFLNTTNSAPALNLRNGRTHAATLNSDLISLNNNQISNGSSSNACVKTTLTATANGGVSPSSSTSSLASSGSGCQVCKRQKTQHNFALFNSNNERDINSSSRMEQNCEIVNHHNENENEVSNEVAIKLTVDCNDGKIYNNSTNGAMSNEDSKNALSMCELKRPCTKSDEREIQQITSSESSSSVTMTSNTATEVMDEECFVSSTKLTPHFDRCALSSTISPCSNASLIQLHPPKKQPPPLPPKPLRHNQNNTAVICCQRSCTPPDPLHVNIDCEFKTPTTSISCQQEQQQSYQLKPTPKSNLLQVASAPDIIAPCCGSNDCSNAPINGLSMQSSSMPQGKILPKVNLTPIFCDGNTDCNMPQQNSLSLSATLNSPDSVFPFDIVTINRVKYERAAAAEAAAAAASQSYTANRNNINNNNNYNNNNSNNNNNNKSTAYTILDNNSAVPVQKSYSAPTLPNSPSLSPRFAKQAAIYKRRSRHLSDRSDRSSLGSDEQFSDEELECGSSNINLINGMMITSPMKQRARFATNLFNRQPLLGNLEESLLQRRISPKAEVHGFKVLLGASGGFCPTQLTIPAAAYFYELYGETLSTPYVCEIRLPRKGYSVPRTGTVQATLLNPLGTVVRMFVIPYDMRDMPPLHQTFIRQRILADMSASSGNAINIKVIEDGEATSMQHSGQLEYNNENGNNQHKRINNVGDGCDEKNLGHFISSEHMKRLRYSIHLRFQTSRSGRLMLHTDIRLLISRRTDCDTAAAHAKGLLEAPNELITDTVMPSNPKYSVRQDVHSYGAAGSSRI